MLLDHLKLCVSLCVWIIFSTISLKQWMIFHIVLTFYFIFFGMTFFYSAVPFSFIFSLRNSPSHFPLPYIVGFLNISFSLRQAQNFLLKKNKVNLRKLQLFINTITKFKKITCWNFWVPVWVAFLIFFRFGSWLLDFFFALELIQS